MASGDGIITRKDIITDEALAFGKEYRKNVDEAIQANKELIDQFKTLLKVSGDYRKAQDSHDFRKAKQEESLLNQKMINELKRLNLAEKELEQIKQEKFKTERELLKVAQENIRLSKLQATQQRSAVKLTMEERVQQQLANKAEKEAVLNKMGLIGAYQKLNAQRTQAKKRLQDLIASEKASNAEIRKAQREFDVLDAKIRKADNAVRDFTKNVGNYKSAFSGISNLMGAFGIVGGVTGVVALGKSIYETTKQIQGQEIALKMLSETESTYAKNKEFLVRISEQYGLELLTTTNAYKNYYASAKTAIEEGKLSFEEMQSIFEKISKSSSMLGLSVEQQEGAFLAISQMMSKGTVQSEELRGQLGERLPGAFEVMAKALNVTTMELGDMLKKGEVMAADVLPKFAVAYEKAIGADQIQRVETLAAAQNRASNKWTEFVENLNSGQGIISKTGMGFFNLTSGILDLIGAKKQFTDVLRDEKLELNLLIGRITDVNIKNHERDDLINKLKDKYPAYIRMIGEENLSNESLRASLSAVNDEYAKRILLQEEQEKLDNAITLRNAWESGILKNQIELYEELIKINEKYNLGLEITPTNAYEVADKVQLAARKNISAYQQLKIESLQADYKTFSKNADQAAKNADQAAKDVEKVKKAYEDLLKILGVKTPTEIAQENSIYEYNKKLDEAIAKAVKLKGVVGKDFSEFDLVGINKFISSKTNSSGGGGESEKARKAREAAEKRAQREREKALKEADKLEKERLKQEKENYEASIDLLIWREKNKAEVYKAESVNEKNTQDERYNALIASQKAEEEALRLNYEKQLTLSRAFQTDKDAFTKQEIDDFLTKEELLKGVNTLTDAELLILEKYYAEQKKLRKDNSKDLEDNVKFEAEQLKKRVDEKAKEISYDNDKLAADEIDKLDIGKNLTDVESYEKAVYDIKRKYLLLSLQQQLDALDKEIEIAQTKGEVDKSILEKQLKLRTEIKEFENQTHVDTLNKAKEMEQRFIEMGEAIKNALVDLTNAIFDNRIQRIDEDIERTNDQYEKQIELYEGDKDRQDAIRKEQEAAREKLEAKKRKEQHKQAVFNKAMAVAEIGWSTAQAIMSIWAQVPKMDFGVSATILTIMAGILGTVQTAAVLATPIPKYKMGRKGGPEEFAIVGDGGVHEVIEHKDGSAEITPKRDTLVKLLEGDTVHSSIDRYRQARRNQFRNDLIKDQIRMDSYLRERETRFDTSGLEKEIKELQKILRNKNMSTTVNVPKVDISHELWRLKQLNH